MVFEKVSFNVDLIKEMSKDEFINHKSYQHLWPKLTIEVRKQRLSELYVLATFDNNLQSGNSQLTESKNDNSRKLASKGFESRPKLPDTAVINRQQ